MVCFAGSRMRPTCDDAAVPHRQAAAPGRRAQAVEQEGVADHEIVHAVPVYFENRRSEPESLS